MPVGVFSVTLSLVALRTAIALLLALTAVRHDVSRWRVLAQGVSDLICAAFLVAYVAAPVRASIGNWAYPMFGYALLWEGALVFRRLHALRTGSADHDASLAVLTGLHGGAALAWTTFAVAPALIAGFFIVFDLGAPGNWLFPGEVPRFVF